jgi:hypothetical protein
VDFTENESEHKNRAMTDKVFEYTQYRKYWTVTSWAKALDLA